MSVKITDNFSGTNGDLLSAHTPDSGGAWTQETHVLTPGTIDIQGNAARCVDTVDGRRHVYTHSEVPFSADYEAEGVWINKSDNEESSIGVGVRQTTSGNDDAYYVDYNMSGTNQWRMRKMVNGTTTTLDSLTQALVTGDVGRIAVTGTTIEWWVNGSSQGQTTDSAISATGSWCIRGFDRATSTTGVHLDSYTGTDAESSETTVIVPLSTATSDAVAPSLQAIVGVPVSTATGESYQPTLYVYLPLATATTDTATPLVVLYSATPTGEATANSPNPTIQAVIAAPVATATGEAYDPTVIGSAGGVISVPLSTATAESFAPTVRAVVSYSSGMFYGSVHYGTAVYGALPTWITATAVAPTTKITITISTGSGSFYGSAVYGVATYVGEAAIRAAFLDPSVQLVVLVPSLAATGEAFSVSSYVKVVLLRSPTMTAGAYVDVFGLMTLMWVDNQGTGDIFYQFEHDDGRTWSADFPPGGESTVDISSGEMYVFFDIENESAYLNVQSVTSRDPA